MRQNHRVFVAIVFTFVAIVCGCGGGGGQIFEPVAPPVQDAGFPDENIPAGTGEPVDQEEDSPPVEENPCVPKTCEQVENQCGHDLDDGCGGVLACGECPFVDEKDVTPAMATGAVVRYTPADGVWIEVTFNEAMESQSVPEIIGIESYVEPGKFQSWKVLKTEVADDLLTIRFQVETAANGFWFAFFFGDQFNIKIDGIKDLSGNISSVTTFVILQES